LNAVRLELMTSKSSVALQVSHVFVQPAQPLEILTYSKRCLQPPLKRRRGWHNVGLTRFLVVPKAQHATPDGALDDTLTGTSLGATSEQSVDTTAAGITDEDIQLMQLVASGTQAENVAKYAAAHAARSLVAMKAFVPKQSQCKRKKRAKGKRGRR
jgi:hypothetical protein